MATYVYDRELGCMVDKATREPMLSEAEKARPLQTPLTYGDMPGYRSPIDGKWVEGRRARAYDMQKNNCIDANELPKVTTGKLRNANFAAKHGLSHMVDK
jgi:hypothetical protein